MSVYLKDKIAAIPHSECRFRFQNSKPTRQRYVGLTVYANYAYFASALLAVFFIFIVLHWTSGLYGGMNGKNVLMLALIKYHYVVFTFCRFGFSFWCYLSIC